MDYINTVLNFLNSYGAIVLPVLFATVFVFGLANWLSNPYRKQNKKLSACYKSTCAYPDKVVKYADKLPQEYRRQWRAAVNCGVKPSVVFEFVARRKRVRLLWLLIVAALVSVSYVAVFFAAERNVSYLVFQVVFALAFGLVMVANKAVNAKQEQRARKTFARLVSQLNKCVPVKSQAVDSTVKQLQQLNKQQVTDAVVGKACEILHSKGLETNRTVDEQRRINSALNGLLQAYSRNASNSRIQPKTASLR